MKLTQQLITDMGILVLGVITAVILVRSQLARPSQVAVVSLSASAQTLVDESNDPIVLIKGGQEFAAKGDLLAAAAAFKKATHLDPNWRDAFVVLGQTYLALAEQQFPYPTGDLSWWEKAEHALLRAKKIDPLHKLTYDYLKIVYEKTSQNEKLSELKTTLKNLPNLQ